MPNLFFKRVGPFPENSLLTRHLLIGNRFVDFWKTCGGGMLEEAKKHHPFRLWGENAVLSEDIAERFTVEFCPLGGGTLYQNTACRSRKSDVGCCWPVFPRFNYNKASRWEKWRPLGQKVGVGGMGNWERRGRSQGFWKFTESYFPPWLHLWCSSFDTKQLFIMPFYRIGTNKRM